MTKHAKRVQTIVTKHVKDILIIVAKICKGFLEKET